MTTPTPADALDVDAFVASLGGVRAVNGVRFDDLMVPAGHVRDALRAALSPQPEVVQRPDLAPGSDPAHDFDGPDPFGLLEAARSIRAFMAQHESGCDCWGCLYGRAALAESPVTPDLRHLRAAAQAVVDGLDIDQCPWCGWLGSTHKPTCPWPSFRVTVAGGPAVNDVLRERINDAWDDVFEAIQERTIKRSVGDRFLGRIAAIRSAVDTAESPVTPDLPHRWTDAPDDEETWYCEACHVVECGRCPHKSSCPGRAFASPDPEAGR